MEKSNDKIDFVVTWVDGNDPEWQKEKKKYKEKESGKKIDSSNIRYRDWENLKYWFRGVEKYAPWVNKVYFITCGQKPKWLNTDNPKLVCVNHSDYMPKDSLPTFNSNAIELMVHKINGLSEQFVLFNDDFFITDYVEPTDFFKNGLPCNTMALKPLLPNINRDYNKTVYNDIALINKNFKFKKTIRKNYKKYLSPKIGKYSVRNLFLFIYNEFVGFNNFHTELCYLKSTFNKVWEKENEALNNTVYSRFRNYEENISHWVFNYWQFAEGKFIQKKPNFSKNILVTDKNLSCYIENHKYKVLGIGDTENICDFDKVKNNMNNSFEKILSEKCSFER